MPILPQWARAIPNDMLAQTDQQDLADSWAQDQMAKLADDWANQQKAVTPPAPPARDDWANPAPFAQSAPTPSDSLTNPLGTSPAAPSAPPEPATGASAPSPESSAVAPSPPLPPAAPAPVASTPTYPAPNAPLPTDFNAGTPTPNAPVTAPLVAPAINAPQGRPQTTAELSGGGAFQGFDTNANALMAWAGDQVRQQYGDDAARAVQSVLATEGGMSGSRGDNGQSAGPLQFYAGGELSNFAQQHGLSLNDAKTYVEQHPQEAITWALNGYLGNALQQGLQKGLTGADLATYIQANGQRSVSPERAAQWYNTLFGSGKDPFTQPITAGQAGQSGINGPAQRTSQFAMGLSTQDAYAFCGPAAAIAFAQTYGRNPTVDEAKALAQQVGWNPGQGMAGITSEQALLSKLGVQTKLEQTINWDHVASDANGGNPVIISTPGHYFYITGARQGPNGMEFNVGTSGTDLRAGSQWMTAADMARTMGQPQGALYADQPLASGPSQAENQPLTQLDSTLGGAFRAVSSKAQDVVDAVKDVGSNAINTGGQALQDFAFNGPIGATRNAVQGATRYVTSGQARADLADNLAQNPIPGAPGLNLAASAVLNMPTVMDQMQKILDLQSKYGKGPMNLDVDPSSMTPEDQQAWTNAIMAIGGITGGEGETPGRPLFGRGGVPGADVGRNPVPAPTQPQDLEESLAQSQLQVVIKQARAQGMSDEDIAAVFKATGASDEQIQNALHPPEPQMVPPSQRPTPREPVVPPDETAAGGSAGQPPQQPPFQYDPATDTWIDPTTGKPVPGPGEATVPPANPMQNVTPQGTLEPGVQNIPGRAGGAEPATMPRNKKPGLMISPTQAGDASSEVPNIDPNASPPGGPTLGQALSAIPAEAKKSIFSLSNVHAGNIFRGLVTSPAGPGGAAQFAQRYALAVVRGAQDPVADAGMADLAAQAQADGLHFFGGQNPETGGAPALFNPVLTAGARALGGGALGAAGGAEYSQQTHDDQLLRDVLVGGTLGAIGGPTVAMRMHDALWQDAVPFAKLMTYKAAVDGGMEGRQAAMFANNLNGGQNLAAIAGSKPVEELARWALQSPDWLLSQVKLTGAGVAGTAKTVARQPLTGNEQLSRDWLLKTLMVYGFATEAVQYALTGHFTDQNSPGSQFQIEYPTGTPSATNGKPQNVTVSLFPGNLGQILDAADRSVTQGAQGLGLTAWDKSNVIPRAGLEQAYNFRYPGGPPITSKGADAGQAALERGAFAGSQFAPLGIFGPAEEVAAGANPLATALLTGLGFPMSHNTRQPIGAPAGGKSTKSSKSSKAGK